MWWKTFLMLGILCFLALVIELDFFIALQKFGAEHFGAPDDIKAIIKNVPDKPKPVLVSGFIVLAIAFLGVAAVLVWAAIDTYASYESYWQVFFRFLTLLWGYKLFDVLCFDWLLMTKIRLPEKLCPETKGAKGYESFGFNAKSQLIKTAVFLLLAFAIALIYFLICK